MEDKLKEIYKKRKVITEEMDKVAIDISILNERQKVLLKQYRELELDEHKERARVNGSRVPTGIMK